MKLTMLGTGHAVVTECYNTCYVITDHGMHFLVDTGGGSTIIRQLRQIGLRASDIHDIFITHRHLDHIMGVMWILRLSGGYLRKGEGGLRIYGHEEVISIIRSMAVQLLPELVDAIEQGHLQLITVDDGEKKQIIGHEVTFFDIRSKKAKQFGFSMAMDADGKRKLTCCGDEPYAPHERAYAEGSEWLLHEAFCLYAERDKYHPYDKQHSTVKDACETAQDLHVENLLLYHTEEEHLAERKRLYMEEGQRYFHGNLFIPDDLESISLL